MGEVQLPRAAFPLGEENNVHAGLAGMAVTKDPTAAQARPWTVSGPERPCFRSENMYDAGNPAVMAPRFRPVALRPRLSAGLLGQPRQYAEEDPPRQARETPNEDS